MKALLFSLTGLALMACTPEMNWRVFRDTDTNWSASFPGKPVSVSRTIQIKGDQPAKVELHLWAVNVNEVRYTVGRAQWVSQEDRPAEQTQESLAKYLETSRLNNIAAGFPQKISAPPGPNEKESVAMKKPSRPALQAVGSIVLNPKEGPIEAILWLQTHPRERDVLEVIVLGPASAFSEEAAEQFFSSFKPRL
jgi:hypothetical protein